MAVGHEGAHAELVGESERLAVVAPRPAASGGSRRAAISPRRRSAQASYPRSLWARASSSPWTVSSHASSVRPARRCASASHATAVTDPSARGELHAFCKKRDRLGEAAGERVRIPELRGDQDQRERDLPEPAEAEGVLESDDGLLEIPLAEVDQAHAEQGVDHRERFVLGQSDSFLTHGEPLLELARLGQASRRASFERRRVGWGTRRCRRDRSAPPPGERFSEKALGPVVVAQRVVRLGQVVARPRFDDPVSE